MSQAKDSQELKKALNYLRSGNLKPARAILVEVLRRDKNNANAWYLLVFTLKSRRQKFMALGRALKINPYHEKAKKLLDQLTGKTDIPQPVSPELPPTGIDEVLPTTIAPVPETPEEIPPPTPEEPPPVVERIPDPDLLDLPVRVSTPTDDTYVPGIRTNDVFEAPPLQAHPSEKSQSKRHLHRTIMAGMLIIVLIVVSWIAFGQDLLSTTPESVGLPVGGLISTNTPTPTNRSSTGIQPTWTPTPSPTATETPLPSPTATATVEPTSPPLHPNITILMNSMQTQIADLRGLEVVDDVSSNIISRSIAQPFLSDLYLTDDLSTSIRNHEIALSMLGLIEPTYDLSSNTLNGMIGGLDGFYLGDKNEIYIIGLGFTPAEKITYAREYDIALVYHHHNLNQLKNNCASSQSCKALQALYEGEAVLMQWLWWLTYASPQDLQGLESYDPPVQLIQEDNPPPYVIPDLDFTFSQGWEFVKYLYGGGDWEEINNAYSNPPTTTEQILHPEKYLAQESAALIEPPPLDEVLDAPWRQIVNDDLGEWMTYLLLAYGNNQNAQVEDSSASRAAAGWGGDTYQVYYHDETNSAILVAHWIWDTEGERTEFVNVFSSYHNGRFAGEEGAVSDGVSCVETAVLTSCFFSSGQEVLWLITPNRETTNSILELYPQFP